VKGERPNKYGLGFWLAFALACTVSFAIEHFATSQLHGSGESSRLFGSVFELDTVYQRLVTAGARPVIPRFTVLVEIRQGIEPTSVSLTNVCGQRGFLARVVRVLRMAPQRPTVIAIDKFFGRDSCPSGDPGTIALADEFVEALQSGVAIVVGKALTRTADGSIQAEPAHDFGLAEFPRFREAVVNVRDDVRAVPLSWIFVTPPNPLPRTASTLALAAAALHRPGLVNESPLLTTYLSSSEPLHVGFLRPSQFAMRRVSAMELVCGSTGAPDWKACFGNAKMSDSFGGGVVVVGEEFRDYDTHNTPVGRMAGYLLQATYLEALLDDRYFRTVPQWVNWIVGLSILLVFEGVFIRYHHPLSILWRVAVLLSLALATAYVIVAVSGYLVAPITVSVLAMGLRFLSLVTRPFER
jgi:hypothetical protein